MTTEEEMILKKDLFLYKVYVWKIYISGKYTHQNTKFSIQNHSINEAAG